MDRPSAILLLGPTGSGKTPLGEFLERHGIWGRRCAHFDFGQHLRLIASGQIQVPELTAAELRVIRESLGSGEVLEDEQFPIAAKSLRWFVAARGLAANDLVILNGLPRHVGQARDLDGITSILAVVNLKCSAETVYERIRLNSGGDRTDRCDDSVAQITWKLEQFAQRTLPLIEHYQRSNLPIIPVSVTVRTSAPEIHEHLQNLRLLMNRQES